MPTFIDLPAAQTSGGSISDLLAQLEGSQTGIQDYNRKNLGDWSDLLYRLDAQNAPRNAGIDVGVQEQFLPRLTDLYTQNAQRADPEGFSLGKLIQNSAGQDLKAGREFLPGQENEIRQWIAAEQNRVGGGTGLSDSVDLSKALYQTKQSNYQTRFDNALKAYGGVGTNRNIGASLQVPTRSSGLPSLSSFANAGPSNADIFNLQDREWNQKAQRANAFNANNLNSANFDVANQEPDALAQYLGLAAGVIGTGVGAAFGTNSAGTWMGGAKAAGGGGPSASTLSFASGGRSQPSTITDQTRWY